MNKMKNASFAILTVMLGLAQDSRACDQTGLIGLIRSNQTQAALLEIRAGKQLSQRDEKGRTPLIWAAGLGQLEVVKALVEKLPRKEINQINKYNESALFWSARKGYYLTAEFLLEQGAYPCSVSVYGETALDWAIKNNHSTTVKILKKNSDVCKWPSDETKCPSYQKHQDKEPHRSAKCNIL